MKSLGNVEATLSGVTVGIYWDWIEEADEETVSVFRTAIEKIKLLGAVVKEIKIPELEEMRVAHIITAVTELSAVTNVDVDKHFSEISAASLTAFALGHHFSAIETVNAMKEMWQLWSIYLRRWM